jgi:hypothetical protein
MLVSSRRDLDRPIRSVNETMSPTGIEKPARAAVLPEMRLVVRAVLIEHRLILTLVLGYIAVGGLVLTTLGRPWPLHFATKVFTLAWLAFSLPWLVWQWLRDPRRLWVALAWPRLAGALLVFLLAVPMQVTVQSLKQAIGPVLGFSWDARLSHIDRILHGGEAWQLYARVVPFSLSIRGIDLLYSLWFIGLFLFVVWASWSRHRELRQRALVAFLLLWIIGGTVVAAVFASAGPCYYQLLFPSDRAYTELSALIRETKLIAPIAQRGLWEASQADVWKPFAGISAFPSMHVAATVIWALVAWRRSCLVATFCWAFALVTQVGSVLLAWHYAIDGYAGALIAWGCWGLAGKLDGHS